MPRPKVKDLPEHLSQEERNRELARRRMQKRRATLAANPDSVRLALVAAAAGFPEDVRRQLVEAMMASVDEDKRNAYRTIACDLLDLPAPVAD